MGRRLILADGTRIEDGEAGLWEGSLWCYLPGWALDRAARIFTNPAKTSEIRYQYGEMEDVFRGYTNCINIMTESGQISVCLVKGAS